MASQIRIIAVAVAFTYVLPLATGYSTGPNPSACGDMVPKHGVLASIQSFPYTIKASTTYCGTSRVTVTISGPSFKGFFCQARPNVDVTESIGKFEGIEGTKSTRNPCEQQTEGVTSAISHADSTSTTSISFTWLPDTTRADNVYIVCTVVQQRITFWVKQISEVIRHVDLNNCPITELPKTCGTNQMCDAAIRYSICDLNADADGNCVCPPDRKFDDPTLPSCLEKGLEDSCTTQNDCRFVNQSTCNAQKCACVTGYIPKSNACVLEQVTDVVCNNNADCSRFQYSSCNLATARCHCTGQAREVGGKCQLKVLGDVCEQDTDCTASIAQAECKQTQTTKTCQCKESYIVQNGQCVIDPTACTADTCKNIPNSNCLNGDCICTSAYKKEAGKCVPKVLRDSCEQDTDCTVGITQAECKQTTKTCQCKTLYIEQNGQCVTDLTVCTADTCKNIPNSNCLDGNCICTSLYKKEAGKCVPKVLGDPCNSNNECSAVQESVCDLGGTKTCICSALYVQQGIKCDLKDPGDVCNADTCKNIPNSFCNSGSTVCNCLSPYKNQSSACVPKGLRDGCSTNNDCINVTNSVCDLSSKTCQCSNSYKPDYTTNRCLWKGLGDICATTDDCKGVLNSFCNNSKCVCIRSYTQSNGECKMKGLDEQCSTNDECKGVQNSLCNNGKCDCISSYKQLNGACQMKGLSDQCEQDADCNILQNIGLECNQDTKICACANGYRVSAENKCISRELGEACQTNENCQGIPMSVCSGVSDKRCACATGYMEQNKRCVLTAYDISCTSNTDCTAIPRAICDIDDTKKCVCPIGYTREETGCNRIELGGKCRMAEDCHPTVQTAICNGSMQCACPTWNKQISTTQCAVKGIGDSCKYNEDCRGIMNSQCDRTNNMDVCTCRAAYKEQSNATHVNCVIRRIGDICSNSAECDGVRGSSCQSDVCSCPDGMKEQNYECVPKVLQKDCDETKECKGVKFAICIGNKCTCSYGYDDVITQDTCRSNGLLAGAPTNTMISGVTLIFCLLLQTAFA